MLLLANQSHISPYDCTYPHDKIQRKERKLCKAKRAWESLKARTRDVSPPLVSANVFLTNQIIKILHNVFGTNNREHTVSTAKRKCKSLSRVLLFVTPWTLQSMELPGQNTGAGSLSLLHGIFPTQGLNPGFPHYRQILYQLSHKGSPVLQANIQCEFLF